MPNRGHTLIEKSAIFVSLLPGKVSRLPKNMILFEIFFVAHDCNVVYLKDLWKFNPGQMSQTRFVSR